MQASRITYHDSYLLLIFVSIVKFYISFVSIPFRIWCWRCTPGRSKHNTLTNKWQQSASYETPVGGHGVRGDRVPRINCEKGENWSGHMYMILPSWPFLIRLFCFNCKFFWLSSWYPKSEKDCKINIPYIIYG